uniref:Immunoglobulin V-set domain-containing protein n=1 Tax=Anas platyrhynchos TaxID=8839 RepID=A0A8B9QLL8_ANAPL
VLYNHILFFIFFFYCLEHTQAPHEPLAYSYLSTASLPCSTSFSAGFILSCNSIKASVEAAFQSHFTSSGIQGDGMTLSTEGAFLNDSGIYYCAESETQWVG